MKKGNIVFLTVGIVILIIILKNFGLESTIIHIDKMGWSFVIIVAIHLISNITYAYAWRILIVHPLKAVQFFKIILARIAGDSTSAINGIGAIAGEGLKAMYVKDIIPFKSAIASVVLDRTIHSISSILVILTGIIVSFFILNLPVYVTAGTFFLMVLALLFFVIILMKQKGGFLEFVISKLPGKFTKRFLTDSRKEKILALDEEIKFVFSSRDNLHHFYISLFIHYVISIFINTLEIYLIIILGKSIPNFPIMHAMFIYIFGYIITSVMFFMPANIGSSEGSYSVALMMLGHDPALGVTIGILRRLRSFIWAGIGMTILFYAGLLKRDSGNSNSK